MNHQQRLCLFRYLVTARIARQQQAVGLSVSIKRRGLVSLVLAVYYYKVAVY